MRVAWAAPLMLLATPAVARFAPVTDTTYRLASAMDRDDGRGVRHFATDYDIVFTRMPNGYRATMRVVPETVRDSRADPIFARLQAAQAGTPLTVSLDRKGRLIAVDDLDSRWARLRDGIAAIDVDTPRARNARAFLLTTHDAATPAQRAQTIAGDLLALCAGDDADRPAGARDTALPASDGTALPVRETVSRDGTTVSITTRDDAGTLTRDRTIDRRTGLVRDMRETRRFAQEQDGRTAAATTTRTARLTLVVSGYPSGMARKP